MAGDDGRYERVARVLAEQVAPALALDGADLELVELEGAEARVRVRAGCVG
jgi:Fe-S cluster biogenesis protein NfuA